MDAKAAIHAHLNMVGGMVQKYLADLSDEELLVRPVPGCNHIAWQLGHCIAGEHQLMSPLAPGKMPPLPKGFIEKYGKESAVVDDPASFHSKDEYLKLMAEQRAGTLAILESLNSAEFDQPSPEAVRSYAPRVIDLLNLQGVHWLMHAGQWTVIRRKLGRPPLF